MPSNSCCAPLSLQISSPSATVEGVFQEAEFTAEHFQPAAELKRTRIMQNMAGTPSGAAASTTRMSIEPYPVQLTDLRSRIRQFWQVEAEADSLHLQASRAQVFTAAVDSCSRHLGRVEAHVAPTPAEDGMEQLLSIHLQDLHCQAIPGKAEGLVAASEHQPKSCFPLSVQADRPSHLGGESMHARWHNLDGAKRPRPASVLLRSFCCCRVEVVEHHEATFPAGQNMPLGD